MQASTHSATSNSSHTISRSASIDILKVFAISSVVFIHAGFMIPFQSTSFDVSVPQLTLAARALRFCVPVFILLWAYFMEKSIMKRGIGSISSRFIKLFIPFLIWSLMYFFLTADFKNLHLVKAITMYWTGSGWSGQYYFIILFQLLILFPAIRKVSRLLINHALFVLIVSFVAYLLVSHLSIFSHGLLNKVGDRLFIYWLPYVILGIIYAHGKDTKIRFPLFVGILSLLLIPAEVSFTHPNSISPYLLPSVLLSSIILVKSVLAVNISYESLKPWQKRIIENIARNTPGIFCLNPLIIILLGYAIHALHLQLHFFGCSIVVPLISTLVVMLLAVLIIYALKRIRLGFLVAN